MKIIDDFLNKITMYRLVLYYLIAIILFAVIFSFFKLLPFDPANIIFSALFLYFFTSFINDIFSKIFSAPLNTESAYITGLILVLIFNPVKSLADFWFLACAAFLAMATKFILSYKRKHIFNPTAISAVLMALAFNHSASWWVGNSYLFPVVTLGGLLVVRKTRREDLIYVFITTAIASVITFSIFKGTFNLSLILNNLLFHSSLLFFAFAMVTEPLTMPTTNTLQIVFAILVGFLFAPDVHLGTLFSTPELSLTVGNIFAFLVSPKYRLMLYLKEKNKLNEDTFDFIFPNNPKINFIPGQYLEWTFAHEKTDIRGNRRYFTIASSPTEDNIRIGVKFYNPASSYKKNLLALDDKTAIVASQLSGDFTLPKNKNQKLVFIAGGIGITPYRSIIKYLIDSQEKRDIIILYSNKTKSEIVYKDVFDTAENKLHIKTIYTLTDLAQIPQDWVGERGRINDGLIKKYVSDWQERLFYLSGPRSMVDAFEDTLKKMGVKKRMIKTDFFPGFV